MCGLLGISLRRVYQILAEAIDLGLHFFAAGSQMAGAAHHENVKPGGSGISAL
jgi:hypothetical protein